ncbi:DJ-1/PfpI family protein [Thalassovita sp.]|jgi:transcriptional regulator GlxA family with amidase domain|uniref:DJ-1/PfpI family protein n=1 Tax=Thalassovita sp. TaxID=1979401 RepID=UPI003B5C20D3
MTDRPKKVGIYIFENMTMIDGYAPLQFFAMAPGIETFTFSKTTDPLLCDAGVYLTPQYGFDDCPDIDVLVMPGGGNVLKQMQDKEVIDFVRKAGEKADYVTSVCTGSLILAEAGLLDGHKAATHWAFTEALSNFPKVDQVDERVCISGNRITGGGMTAGLDFALTVISEIIEEPAAHVMQLLFEYRPAPPFNSGGPETAPEFAVQAIRGQVSQLAGDLFEYTKTKAA